MNLTRRWLALTCISLAACAPPQPAGEDGHTTTTNGATSSTDTGTESGASSEVTTGDGDGTPTTTTGDGDGDGAPNFVPEADLPPPSCSVADQDCPEGEKCVPMFGMGFPPDTTCVPILGDAMMGDPCTPSPDGDECDANNFCFTSNMGMGPSYCVTLCDPNNPVCPDGTSCSMIGFCRPDGCNPLDPDPCPNGWPCLGRVGDGSARCSFLQGASYGMLGIGEVCSVDTDCAQGSACTTGTSVPDCAGEFCCTAWCDPANPDSCIDEVGTTCMTAMDPSYGRCEL